MSYIREKISRVGWSLLSDKDKDDFISRLGIIDHIYYKNLLNNKAFPKAFTETKSIFIHVPKCAGSSIVRSAYSGHAVTHSPAVWYQNRFEQYYRDYFTFAFTRNPWGRLYSAWSYLIDDKRIKRDKQWREFLLTFRDFNDFVETWLSEENALRQIHFSSQCSFLEDRFGGISLDYIGRYENLKDDVRYISDKIGRDIILSHINKSDSTDFRPLYSSKSVDRVADVYKKDIELFGYDFE